MCTAYYRSLFCYKLIYIVVVVIDVAGLVRSIIYCRHFVCSLRHRSLIRIYQSAKIPGQNQVRDRRQLINPVRIHRQTRHPKQRHQRRHFSVEFERILHVVKTVQVIRSQTSRREHLRARTPPVTAIPIVLVFPLTPTITVMRLRRLTHSHVFPARSR